MENLPIEMQIKIQNELNDSLRKMNREIDKSASTPGEIILAHFSSEFIRLKLEQHERAEQAKDAQAVLIDEYEKKIEQLKKQIRWTFEKL